MDIFSKVISQRGFKLKDHVPWVNDIIAGPVSRKLDALLLDATTRGDEIMLNTQSTELLSGRSKALSVIQVVESNNIPKNCGIVYDPHTGKSFKIKF